LRKPIYAFEKRADKRHTIGWVLLAIVVIIAAYLIYTKKEDILLIIIAGSLTFIVRFFFWATEEDLADSFRLRISESDYFLIEKLKSFFKKSK
jgi:chromate transport protein ChrA